MKLAVVTVDQQTVGQHFGRSPYYVIFTIENGEITAQEIRERRTGHFAQNQSHSHDHNHDHSQGHGTGPEHDAKHDEMAREIGDCQVLIAGGMGRGAYDRFFSNGINVIMTDVREIKQAVELYIKGDLNNLFVERTH